MESVMRKLKLKLVIKSVMKNLHEVLGRSTNAIIPRWYCHHAKTEQTNGFGYWEVDSWGELT
eukprot:3123982-Amphidinium_carterae.1